MKKLLILSIILLPIIAFAGESNVLLDFLSPLLSTYAVKYKVLGDILGVMVTFRLIMKPIMSALLAVGKDLDFKILKDLEKIAGGNTYKTVAFLLDWILSIKLPKKT